MPELTRIQQEKAAKAAEIMQMRKPPPGWELWGVEQTRAWRRAISVAIGIAGRKRHSLPELTHAINNVRLAASSEWQKQA